MGNNAREVADDTHKVRGWKELCERSGEERVYVQGVNPGRLSPGDLLKSVRRVGRQVRVCVCVCPACTARFIVVELSRFKERERRHNDDPAAARSRVMLGSPGQSVLIGRQGRLDGGYIVV